jgi:hypothetical protein
VGERDEWHEELRRRIVGARALLHGQTGVSHSGPRDASGLPFVASVRLPVSRQATHADRGGTPILIEQHLPRPRCLHGGISKDAARENGVVEISSNHGGDNARSDAGREKPSAATVSRH